MAPGRRKTRNRILVSSLLLFNEHGVAGASTNDIANETGISPGNLHYHFPRKSQLVDALMAEFQVDVRDSLVAPTGDNAPIDDFWSFLHGVLEILTAYRFLFRDTDSLVADYPGVASAVRGFTCTLIKTLEHHVQALGNDGILTIQGDDARQIARQVGLVMLYGERLDRLMIGCIASSASSIVTPVMALLAPYADPAARTSLLELEALYWDS